MTINCESDDLVAQLRGRARYLYDLDQVRSPALMREAAEEIETLRDKLRITVEMGDRNAPEHPTPTQYAPELSPELLQRLQRLARRVAEDLDHEAGPVECALQLEARSIVSDLPQEVDPDLIEARRIAFVHAYSETDPEVLTGRYDKSGYVRCALEALARGRQLQRGEAA